VEAETALVGAQSRVELNTISFVDLTLSLVVLPDNAELDYALGDRCDFEGLLVFWVLLEEGGVLQGGDEFLRIRQFTLAFMRLGKVPLLR
jgi:hypothetical protein